MSKNQKLTFWWTLISWGIYKQCQRLEKVLVIILRRNEFRSWWDVLFFSRTYEIDFDRASFALIFLFSLNLLQLDFPLSPEPIAYWFIDSAGGTLGTAPESVQGSFQDSGVAITSPAEFSPNPVYAETVVDAMATQRPLQPRQKRQDWCRWPVCEGYLKSGVCPNEKGPGCEGATCNLAHIRSDEASSVTADGYIRVCFDSMGLLQVGLWVF